MTVSREDRLAIVLTTSSLGQAPGVRGLGPRGWAHVAASLAASGSAPADLLGLSAEALAGRLAMSLADGEAMAGRLDRAAQVAIELDRLDDRGIWCVVSGGEHYPARLMRLEADAPPVLYGSGDPALVDRGGIAIVGSREADEESTAFATELAAVAGHHGVSVVSGGARGIDRAAMRGSVAAGGTAVGVLADSLERAIRESETRRLLAAGEVALVTPYVPSSAFSVGAAMGRNKFIYALSDAAVVVTSDEGRGGTWAGAVDALRRRIVPVFVRIGGAGPAGNQALAALGAKELPSTGLEVPDLPRWLLSDAHRPLVASDADDAAPAVQETLFGTIEPPSRDRKKARTRARPAKL